MSASFGLFRLQQVDSRLSQIEARLSKIRSLLENDAELQAALARTNGAQAAQIESERGVSRLENEVKNQELKIQQAESSLYSGTIHNPKELQDLQADILSLKKHLNTLQDQELQSMLNLEASQAEYQKASSQLAQVRAARGNEHGQLIAEQEALSRDREDLLTERQATVTAVAAEMLDIYEGLKRDRRGVAVAEVRDSACGACGTMLTPALQQNARHTAQLVYCPTCGRILYAN